MKDMGVISKNDNQLTLYYNGESSIGKQCYAYVQASDKAVLGVDISKTEVTPTQWTELAEGLNIKVKDLLGTDHPDFRNIYGEDALSLETNDWLKILEKNPELVQFPVLIFGQKFYQLKSGADFKKYMEGDSANIERNNSNF
jgi:arsenate reductase-like glutaredoxin family protein